MCAWIVSNHPRPDHAPIVIVIQSERLEHSVCARNQSAKHSDSGCLSISGVVLARRYPRDGALVQRLFARFTF